MDLIESVVAIDAGSPAATGSRPAPPRGRSFAARDVMIEAPALPPVTACGEAFKALADHPDRPCLAVVGDDQRIEGLIDRTTFMARFGLQYGRPVYEKRPVRLLMDRQPMLVDEDEEIDDVMRLIAARHPQALVTGFLVTRGGRYAGVGVPIMLLARSGELARLRSMEIEESRREAEAANAAKSQFLATMSHEIRTPLNGVIANLELMRHTPLGPDQAELVAAAEVSAQTLLGLIGDVLDLSRIEANRLEIEQVDMEPAQVLAEVKILLGARALQKGLALRSFVGHGVPRTVRGDPFRLRQVVMNFASNAIKFTESGCVQMSLWRAPAPPGDARAWLRFEVSDTGKGFAPGVAGALFDAFTQEDSSTTRRYGGTGLGLAIARKIAALMGGRVEAVGDPGVGATFACEIPAEIVAPGAPLPSLDLRRTRVVIVGSGDACQPLTAALFACGAAVNLVPDAAAAAALMAASGAQAATVTAVAAVAPSSSTADGLAAALGSARPPLIAVAGARDGEGRSRAYRAGYALAIPGPPSPAVFLHAIAAVAGLAPCEAEAAAPRIGAAEVAAAFAGRGLAPVLVIDDTPMNRTVAERQLRTLGLACTHAEDGQQALEITQFESFSAILCDVSMPVLDGYGFARAFRERERRTGRRRTPILAFTGNVVDGEAERCKAAGMDDYLSKPVTLGRLGLAIAAWTATIPAAPQPTARTDDSRAAGGPNAPVDLKLLGELLGEQDRATLAAVLGGFAPAFGPMIERAAGLCDDACAEELRAIAHAAKGAARSAAAMSLGATMERIEQGAGTSTAAERRDLVADATDEFARVRHFVAALSSRQAAP